MEPTHLKEAMRRLRGPRQLLGNELGEFHRAATGAFLPTSQQPDGKFSNEATARAVGIWMAAVEWTCRQLDPLADHLAGQSQATRAVTMTEQQVADIIGASDLVSNHGYLTILNGDPIDARIGFLTCFANHVLAAAPQAPTAQEVTQQAAKPQRQNLSHRNHVGAGLRLAEAIANEQIEATQQAAKAETAEQAKPIAAAVRTAERIDAMHKGVVGVFAAIKAEHLAQANVLPPTRSTESQHVIDLDGSGYIKKEQRTTGEDGWLLYAANGELVRGLSNAECGLVTYAWRDGWMEGMQEGAELATGGNTNDKGSDLAPTTSTVSAPEEVRERVWDAVAGALDGVYYCNRVWSAWSVGTMSEDDFTPASEDDDILDNVVNAVFEALRTTSGKGEAAANVPCVDGHDYQVSNARTGEQSCTLCGKEWEGFVTHTAAQAATDQKGKT